MFPQVKFQLNKALDKRMANIFLDTNIDDFNLSRCVTNPHPTLAWLLRNDSRTRRHVSVKKYVDHFYQEHGRELENALITFTQDWRKAQGRFFDLVKEIFHNHPIPPGKYVGYLSVFDCNPRFLHNKTFQIFYHHRAGSVYVTAHELLHFIFYDYARQKFPELFRQVNMEKGIFWDIAEIFNSVVMHTKPFIEIHEVRKVITYPQHQIYLSRFRAFWREKPSIEAFIQYAHRHLSLKLSVQ